MVPLLALLLILGFTRLMASERLPRLARLRRGWRRLSPRIAAWVRRAPATYTYLLILLVTTWVLATSSSTVAHALLLERSTNLHELTNNPVRVLIASAFFLASAPAWLVWAALFTLIAAPVEHRIGSGRAVAVFAFGHVGATLLTAVGLWLALQDNLVQHSVVRAVDVGASYGFVALAGVLTYLLPRGLRRAYARAFLLALLAALALSPSFTDFGHLLALLSGLAWRRLVPVQRHPHGDSGAVSACRPCDARANAEFDIDPANTPLPNREVSGAS